MVVSGSGRRESGHPWLSLPAQSKLMPSCLTPQRSCSNFCFRRLPHANHMSQLFLRGIRAVCRAAIGTGQTGRAVASSQLRAAAVSGFQLSGQSSGRQFGTDRQYSPWQSLLPVTAAVAVLAAQPADCAKDDERQGVSFAVCAYHPAQKNPGPLKYHQHITLQHMPLTLLLDACLQISAD